MDLRKRADARACRDEPRGPSDRHAASRERPRVTKRLEPARRRGWIWCRGDRNGPRAGRSGSCLRGVCLLSCEAFTEVLIPDVWSASDASCIVRSSHHGQARPENWPSCQWHDRLLANRPTAAARLFEAVAYIDGKRKRQRTLQLVLWPGFSHSHRERRC